MTERKDIGDEHHTFRELYEHRYWLWIKLCNSVADLRDFVSITPTVWRSKLHSDGTMFRDSFVLGMMRQKSHQMTYHLPMRLWEHCEFAQTLERAPEYDGHDSNDVLERIKKL